MRNRARWAVAFAASASMAAVGGDALAQKVAGDWHGMLDFNGTKALISVRLKAKAHGGYEGALKGPKGKFALKNIKLDKATLSFSGDGGDYSGRWDGTRKAWVGQWIFPMTVIAPAGAAPPTSLPTIPASPLVLTAGKQ